MLSISFLKIFGAKNNPVRSSSDQTNFKHNFLLKYIPKAHKIALYFMFIHRENALKPINIYHIVLYKENHFKKQF